MPQRISAKDLFNIERLEAARPQTMFEKLKTIEEKMEPDVTLKEFREYKKYQKEPSTSFDEFRHGMNRLYNKWGEGRREIEQGGKIMKGFPGRAIPISHEQSVTIQDPKTGRWVNIPSVINGKKVSEDAAADAYRSGKLPALGGTDFSTVDEAVGAAK